MVVNPMSGHLSLSVKVLLMGSAGAYVQSGRGAGVVGATVTVVSGVAWRPWPA